MFSLTHKNLLTGPVKAELEQYVPRIGRWAKKEHAASGEHGAMTAESMTLQSARVGEVVELPLDNARFEPDPNSVTNGTVTWTLNTATTNYIRIIRVGQMALVQFNLDTTMTGDGAPPPAYFVPTALVIKLPELHGLYSGRGVIVDPNNLNFFYGRGPYGGSCEYHNVGSAFGFTFGVIPTIAQVTRTAAATRYETTIVLNGPASGFGFPAGSYFWPYAAAGVGDIRVKGYCWITLTPDNSIIQPFEP